MPYRNENLSRLREISIRLNDKEFELTEANALLAAIIRDTDEAILTKNFDGVGSLTSWNPGAERLYGFTAEEAVGQPMEIIVPENKMGELEEMMTKVKGGESVKIETTRLCKSGKEVQVKMTVSPLRNIDGKVIGASAIAHPANRDWQSNE